MKKLLFQAASRLTISAVLALTMMGLARAQENADTSTPAVTPEAVEVAAATTVDEVVVSAEFRSETLLKTPIAVSVFNTDDLKFRVIDDLRDLNQRTPGLYISPAGLNKTTASYYIRGIGETDSLQNQTVGTYVDDVYIPRPTGGTFELNDVSSVEVLRGPQGTLYGRNSSAGAIRITTETPGDIPTTFAEVGYGTNNALIVRSGFSGPIIRGVLAGGITLIRREADGSVYNVPYDETVGDVESTLIRGKLNWTPTGNLAVLLTGDYYEDLSDPTPLVPTLQPNGQPNTNPDRNFSETQISNDTDLGGVSVRALYTLNDNSQLKSVTSFRAFKQPGWYDQDGTNLQTNRTFSNHRDESYTQELQYLYDSDRFHLVAGAFYFHDNFRSFRLNGANTTASNSLLTARTEIVDGEPFAFEPRQTLQNGKEVRNSLSGYAQGTYSITDQFRLTLGGRYTSERSNFRYNSNEQNAAGTRYLNQLYTINVPDVTWDSFTPKVGLSYDFSDTTSTYYTYSEGFKGGGFDNRATSKLAAQTHFDPEVVTSHEIGLKSRLFDRRFQFNLAAFTNDIEGYQATALNEDGISNRINLARVKTKGFEIDSTTFIGNLAWDNNLSYLDSEIVEVSGAAGNAQYLGKQVPNSPEWFFVSALDYTLPLQEVSGSWRVGGEYAYRSELFVDAANDPGRASPAQGIFNLSATYTTRDEHWQLLLSVKNVLDERNVQSGSALGAGSRPQIWNDPRTVSIRARYQF